MTTVIHVAKLRRKIDFAILSVRDDEYEAVLRRFTPSQPVHGGLQVYEFVKFYNGNHESVSILFARQLEQGHTAAQNAARNILEDVAPRWLLLVGIAGAIADPEFSLGDVLLASNLLDLSVTAAIEESQTQFRTTGAMMHPKAQGLMSALPGWRERLADWGTPQCLITPKPTVIVQSDLAHDSYYGNHNNRESILASLRANFPEGQPLRAPRFKIGTLATSNVLLKDTALLAEWRKVARQISHVEMEAGGVMSAAHAKQVPLLCVRGISDVVGLKRDVAWTQFACDAAASFVRALLVQVPQGFFDSEYRPSIRERTSKTYRRFAKWLTGISKSVGRVLGAGIARIRVPFKERTKTIEDIVSAFELSSRVLLSKSVDDGDRLPIPQLGEIISGLKVPGGGIVCVLGSPGSGKTALLAQVAKEAMQDGVATFALRADLVLSENTLQDWGLSAIGSQMTAIDAVRLVATRRPVLVVVDQLDAVGSNVDLRSGILHSLLHFLGECSRSENVSLICSCRRFDFYNDVRLRSLSDSVIELTNPPWKSIEALLERNKVPSVAAWSAATREMMSRPQVLNVFLTRFKATGDSDTNRSYHQMLEDEWQRMVSTTREAALVEALTAFLSDKESVYAPEANFSSFKDEQVSLIRKGMLTLDQGKLGFGHQTLLEHAKARRFSTTAESLVKFVIDRQDAVFVRPTLLAVLGYLREVHATRYQQELLGLLAASPRLHIRFLIIEWIGQQQKPLDAEIQVLLSLMDDDDSCLRVLIAIHGSVEWFDRLSETHLPAVMARSANRQWPMISVLLSTVEKRRAVCFSLIERHWLTDHAKDTLTWRFLHELAAWDHRSLSIAQQLIFRKPEEKPDSWHEQHGIEILAKHMPDEAASLAASILGQENESSEAGARSILEIWQGWHFLPGIARLSPVGFVSAFWPICVTTCDRFYSGHSSSVLRRYGGFLTALDDERHEWHAPILQAIYESIEAVAKIDPSEFYNITVESWRSESAVLHRLLLAGMRCTPNVSAILEYLSGDDRRLYIGDSLSESYSESAAAIAHAAASASPEQLVRLEQIILSSTKYRPGVDLIPEQHIWQREAHLRLLAAIGDDRLTPATRAFVVAEREQLPDWDATSRRRSRGGPVHRISPISGDQLLAASEDALMNAVASAADAEKGRWTWIESQGAFEEPGGEDSIGSELAGIAKDNPDQAMKLLVALIRRGATTAAATTLHLLQDEMLSDDQVFDAIRTVRETTKVDSNLHEACAYQAYKRARNKVGLPDDILQLLLGWFSRLADGEVTKVLESEDESTGSPPRDVESVLWGRGGGHSTISGKLWTLLALTRGYLMREIPACDQWIAAVSHILSIDVSLSLWEGFCADLRWIRLKNCDHVAGIKLVQDTFRLCDGLSCTTKGARLLGNVSYLMPSEWVQQTLHTMRRSRHFVARQSYGELLALIAARDTEKTWATAELRAMLDLMSDSSEWDEAVATGLAFSAANLWEDSSTQEIAGLILQAVIPIATPAISSGIQQVFWTEFDLEPDIPTKKLLATIAQFPQCLATMRVDELVQQLRPLTPSMPDIVLGIVKQIVALNRVDFQFHSVAPEIVEITMTLQRFDATREGGLRLLEELLKMGLDVAFRVLRDIDMPQGSEPPTKAHMPRRRRRR